MNQISRRQFLKAGSAAAFSTAILGMLSGCSSDPQPKTTTEQVYDPKGLIQYMKDNPTSWMSVDNGYWSEKPEDKPTKEELTTMCDVAMMAQLAVQFSEVFCVVLQDVQDQFDVIGDYWDQLFNAKGRSVTEGTATILFYADKILPQEQHATPYGSYVDSTTGLESEVGNFYSQSVTNAYLDTGIAMGWLQFAAHALGYNTHIFGGLYGEAAKTDPTRYIDGKGLKRGWGFVHSYGEDIKDIPVDGNMKLVAAVVIGKVAEGEDAMTAASKHMRPTNYSFYDGHPGEKAVISPTADSTTGATSPDATSAPTVTAETE